MEYNATGIEEYLSIIDKIGNNKWYRGHSSDQYLLLPSIFRDQRFHSDFYGRIGKKFQSFTRPRYGNYIIMNENIGDKVMNELYKDSSLTKSKRMYRNQHNGMPTRLLDFTSNPLIGLFFCIENHDHWKPKKDYFGEEIEIFGEVIVIDPIIITSKSILHNEIIKSDEDVDHFSNFGTPFAIEPPEIDNRIIAQESKFIYFGYKFDPLDTYEVFDKFVHRIKISNACKPQLLKDLIEKGISYKSVYPDFEGYAKYAKYLMKIDLDEREKNLTTASTL